MSTLVGLGASASFGVSCIAAGLPSLGWKTFFEEPAMLLGFVLVGRALEERAKLQASADMAALQVCRVNIWPFLLCPQGCCHCCCEPLKCPKPWCQAADQLYTADVAAAGICIAAIRAYMLRASADVWQTSQQDTAIPDTSTTLLIACGPITWLYCCSTHARRQLSDL